MYSKTPYFPSRSDIKLKITKLKLWNEANINISTAVCGLHCNKSGISTHQSDQTHTVIDTDTFNISWSDGFDTFRNCSFETKRFVNDWNVIVDSFWNTYDADFKVSLSHFLAQNGHTSMGSVTSDNVNMIDSFFEKSVEDFCLITNHLLFRDSFIFRFQVVFLDLFFQTIESTSWTSQCGSSFILQFLNSSKI